MCKLGRHEDEQRQVLIKKTKVCVDSEVWTNAIGRSQYSLNQMQAPTAKGSKGSRQWYLKPNTILLAGHWFAGSPLVCWCTGFDF